MTPQARGRTQPCSDAEARNRYENAVKFLDVAELVSNQATDPEYGSQAASLAVLAGIAASDAACCKALGRRSRGEDHHDAEVLIGQIEPGGKDAVNDLRRLLNLKDEAQYGFYDVSGGDVRRFFARPSSSYSSRKMSCVVERLLLSLAPPTELVSGPDGAVASTATSAELQTGIDVSIPEARGARVLLIRPVS